MLNPFTYSTAASRIVFGSGRSADVAQEVERAGRRRALVLSTPQQADSAAELADRLGSLAAGVHARAAMHTPVDVTEEAVAAYDACGADCVISLGGGSSTGLGKAIAYRNDAFQIVLPTTYAGSEVTPILGQTEGGLKTTLKSPSVLPEVVIYDPDLTLTLPAAMSVTSGMNAMAHAVEALYAQDRNPISSLMAVEGLRAFKSALPRIVADPSDLDARSDALYGAWLCGTVLGTVGMALHHKLCHTLGGTFNLPHAETHAILLPHTATYNELAARNELLPAAALFGGCLGVGLHELAEDLGAPLSLKDYGFTHEDIARAVELAIRTPYWNPRNVTAEGLTALLQHALDGESPAN